MESKSRRSHWENVYSSKSEREVSWFQENPALSLALITESRGFHDITVLDLSAAALETAKARRGKRTGRAHWLVADATTWEPSRTYDVWHDRAASTFSPKRATAPPWPGRQPVSNYRPVPRLRSCNIGFSTTR